MIIKNTKKNPRKKGETHFQTTINSENRKKKVSSEIYRDAHKLPGYPSYKKNMSNSNE